LLQDLKNSILFHWEYYTSIREQGIAEAGRGERSACGTS